MRRAGWLECRSQSEAGRLGLTEAGHARKRPAQHVSRRREDDVDGTGAQAQRGWQLCSSLFEGGQAVERRAALRAMVGYYTLDS